MFAGVKSFIRNFFVSPVVAGPGALLKVERGDASTLEYDSGVALIAS